MGDNTSNDLKMYCIIRQDIVIPLGKAMVQSGHAFVGALRRATEETRQVYLQSNYQKKIVLAAKDLIQLHRCYEELQAAEIPCCLVNDAGFTVFSEPTDTCVGVSPVCVEQLPKYVKRLRLL